MSPKIQGYCTCCDKEVFEVISIFPDGPFAGRPSKIGKPLDCAMRVHFLLTDGSHMGVTFCDECTDMPLPEMWHKCLEAFKFEIDNRAAFGGKALNPEQQKQFDKEMLRIVNLAPIGLIAKQRWCDAQNT